MISPRKYRGNLDSFALPADHVFAILGQEVKLYEFIRRDRNSVTMRSAEPPHLHEEMSCEEFDDLVRRGMVDPRFAQNPPIGNGRHQSEQGDRLDDLPDDDRAAVEFYFKLCRRVNDKYEAGEIKLTDASLKQTLRQIAGDLAFDGSGGSLTTSGVRKRGSKKTAPVPEPRLLARKQQAIFMPPSPSTVRAYIKRLKANDWRPSTIRDLRKGRRRMAASRRGSSEDRIMLRWVEAYKCRSQPTKALLYKLMLGTADVTHENDERRRNNRRVVPVDDLPTFASENARRSRNGDRALTPPSRRTFEREIEKLDQFHVTVAREGEAAARRAFRIGGRREGALTAGERVLIDCWRGQLMSLKVPGEFWVGLADDEIAAFKRLRLGICVALCEASKLVLGIRICLNPNEEVAIETLEMVCRDKTDIAEEAGCIGHWSQTTTPIAVGCDNGSEFAGARFQEAVSGISSDYEAGPARTPDARPSVERFFRTVDQQLMPMFQGRTFGGVAAKGDYDPGAKANVTAELLGKALIRWIVDVYHNTEHEGLGGETPNNAWNRLVSTYDVLPPPSTETMRAVFGVSTTRRIQNRGIRFMGLFYRRSEDNQLAKLRIKVGQGDVRIRIDHHNLGAILVRENVPNAEWFTVKCDVDAMEGVDASSWIEANRLLRRQNRDQSKLSEPVVLKALHDIRRMGLESAAAAGIGPSTMTRESLLAIEEREFRDLNIQVPAVRGGALDGIAESAEPLDEPTNAGDDIRPHGQPAERTEVPATRRRGGIGKNFLEED